MFKIYKRIIGLMNMVSKWYRLLTIGTIFYGSICFDNTASSLASILPGLDVKRLYYQANASSTQIGFCMIYNWSNTRNRHHHHLFVKRGIFSRFSIFFIYFSFTSMFLFIIFSWKARLCATTAIKLIHDWRLIGWSVRRDIARVVMPDMQSKRYHVYLPYSLY